MTNDEKIKLFNEVVKLFKQDLSYKLNTVIPGAYVKSCIDPKPSDNNLVLIGTTPGALFYAPSEYADIVEIRDGGYWDYKLVCPITGEEIKVSKYLGNSAETRLFLDND